MRTIQAPLLLLLHWPSRQVFSTDLPETTDQETQESIELNLIRVIGDLRGETIWLSIDVIQKKLADITNLDWTSLQPRLQPVRFCAGNQSRDTESVKMVRWQSGERSRNVEDRRSSGPRRMAFGGGGTILMLVLVFIFSGGDLGQVLRFFIANQGQVAQQQRPQQAPSPEDDEMADFASVILRDTEVVWTKLFAEMGRDYTPTTMVLYRQQVRSGCGNASSTVGPFYCPADQKLYLDLSFFEELNRRFGAPGDFARAYVIAHEVGHHVQDLLGTMKLKDSFRGRMSDNEFSVRLELQADFLAGVWAHYAQVDRNLLEEGDIEEGLRAASAIGDDTLQKKSQGYVVKESFTHGTSAQRVRWFRKGFETGDLNQGDTFHAREL